ncbi:MAG: signal peptidase I [Chloroflexi bacterium]|nr:signal peptidase I [Chloroflexota bacterium]
MLYPLLALCCAKRVVVREWSMSPTLLPDEYVLVDRLAYWFGHPQRGDIVLARHPHRPEMLLLKRVAALPGEQVRCDAAGCWPITRHGGAAGGGGVPATGRDTWEVGANEYFLVGDAADLSTDSRQFGPVARRAILGRAWLVYWPTARWRRLSGDGRTPAV